MKLLVWVHKNDIVTEKQRERIAYWADLGIAGIKPDFFDSATQSTMQLYDTLLKLTAEDVYKRQLTAFHSRREGQFELSISHHAVFIRADQVGNRLALDIAA